MRAFVLGHWPKSLFTESMKLLVCIRLARDSALALPLWYLSCYGKVHRGAMSFSLSMPVGSLHCLPHTDRHSWKACSGVEGFAKEDIYRVIPAPLAQNCSQKELGRQLPFYFFSFHPSDGSPDGVAPEDTEIRLRNCFCSLT